MTRSNWERILGALQNEYRRRLLTELLDHNPRSNTITIPDDVHVGKKPAEVLEAELFHTHLTRLEEAGYIQWNRDDNEIRKGSLFDEIRPVIVLVENHTDELPDGWL